MTLLTGERGDFERVTPVGIALHHHRGGQHHCERDGCEDKADNFQAAAIRHGRPLRYYPLGHISQAESSKCVSKKSVMARRLIAPGPVSEPLTMPAPPVQEPALRRG